MGKSLPFSVSNLTDCDTTLTEHCYTFTTTCLKHSVTTRLAIHNESANNYTIFMYFSSLAGYC